jgi:GT2 family glycosyltransferase
MADDIDPTDSPAELDRLAQECKILATENQELLAECSQMTEQLQSLERQCRETENRRRAEGHAGREKISALEIESHRLLLALKERDAEIEAIHRTKIFRYTARLRGLYGIVRRRAGGAPVPGPPEAEDRSYSRWVEAFDIIDGSTRDAIRRRVDLLPEKPLVSIIFPVYNTAERHLSAAIESVLGQIYPHWELCVADDASTEPHVAAVLARYADRDPRIKVTTRPDNGHISAASNTALEMASGAWVTPLDHDDLLTEHALALAMLAAHENPDAQVIYSDEDKIDDAGRRCLPNFKPDFDPLLLLGQNYLTHLLFVRRPLVVAAGGYRLGYEGSQDWDLILRVTEGLEPSQIVHIPHVLYHWRAHDQSTSSLVSAKPYAVDAGQRAVVDHLARRGLEADVTRVPWLGHNRVTWHLPEAPPLVSIIIATRDGDLLARCIDSLLAFTSYPNFEIVVVDNGSEKFATLDYLREHEHDVTVIRDDRPFNFSALNNAAVERTSGRVLCLLNDDTEVIAEEWLTEMVGHLLQPGVGAVGAKLYYPDGRIQHGGVIVGIGAVAGHAHRMSDRLSPGYCGRLLSAQNFSAVTGACMLVRRQAWEEVGGLDEENLAIAFNDVDFGLRLRRAGWRVVWTPHATLYHHESVSRGSDTVDARAHGYGQEVDFMQRQWGPAMRRDPCYNPNLTADSEDFALAWPPRVSYR